MRKFHLTGFFILAFVGAAFLGGCQQQSGGANPAAANANPTDNKVDLSPANAPGATTAANGGANTANGSAGTPGAAANNGTASATNVTIEAREPEQYQAMMALRLEPLGGAPGQQMNLPPITAQIARSGADRRVEFSLPNGENMIYLEKSGKQFMVFPRRGQFAELSKDSTGFQLQRLMSPADMVERAKNLKGVERVGEEQVGGRAAVKYHYSGTANTKSQAGTVQTEATFLVDKETGLPLRSETVSESQSGDVKGMKGFKLVSEITDLRTRADAALFEVPPDLKKVEDSQVRGQINLLMGFAGQMLGQLLNAPAQNSGNPATSPQR